MKFSAVLSTVLFALVATALADPNAGRQGNGKGGAGGAAAAKNAGGAAKGAAANKGAAGGKGAQGGQGAAASNTAAGNNKSSSTDTAAAAAASSAASNNNNNNNNNNGENANNAQNSTTLDPKVIATGFALDGQQTPADGQVASLTSTNNYINFCLTVNKPLTNGQQVKGGSCNPAPMGVIAASTNMPSAKFAFPANGQTIAANQDFTIKMAINNLQAGNFVNAEANYYSAPQQVDSTGNIIGHSHVVVETLNALDQTTPLDPTKFAFFKGINGAAQNGVITADVTGGLPAGVYRMASINSAANHQPVLVAIAQHGSLDDMAYFTVSDNGAAANNSSGGDAAASASAAAASSSSAAGNNNNGGNQGGNKGAAANAGAGANKGAAGGAAGANKGAAGAAAGGNKGAAAGAGAKGGAKGGKFRFARELD